MLHHFWSPQNIHCNAFYTAHTWADLSTECTTLDQFSPLDSLFCGLHSWFSLYGSDYSSAASSALSTSSDPEIVEGQRSLSCTFFPVLCRQSHILTWLQLPSIKANLKFVSPAQTSFWAPGHVFKCLLSSTTECLTGTLQATFSNWVHLTFPKFVFLVQLLQKSTIHPVAWARNLEVYL